MAKAAGSYANFENPDQFRAVDTENGTRPDLLFVGIQEKQILGEVQVWRVSLSECSSVPSFLSFSRHMVSGANPSKTSSQPAFARIPSAIVLCKVTEILRRQYMLMASPGMPRYSSACFIVAAKKSWKDLPQRPYVSKAQRRPVLRGEHEYF